MKFLSQPELKRFLAPDFYRQVLDLLIEASYLGVIFLVPLWFAYLFPTYNIFDFNKAAVFKILVWMLFLFTALKAIFFRSRCRFISGGFLKKYWLWPAVFIIGLGLTLLFSDNLLLSFYGSIERQGGLVSYLFYFLWFLLVSFNILTVDNHWPQSHDSKVKKIGRIIKAAVVSATLVSVYGILQILNIDFLTWPEPALLTKRTFSTLGQPNFLASWLLLVIPLCVYLGWSARRFLTKFSYFLAAALQVACLFLTGSRGGLLALFFAGALYLIYLFATVVWSRRRKLLIGLGFVASIFILLFVANILLPGHISNLLNHQYGSVGARANFYAAAADSIKARPWFGYGLEGGNEIFIKYYEPDWAVYGDVGQSADRAHNLVLDTLLSVGSFGLALLVLLYYFFFSLAKENLKRKRQIALSLALALGAAAYLFSLLFSFAIVTGEIYFWLFLALLAAINYEVDETGRKSLSVRIGLLIRISVAGALAVLSFWGVSSALRSLQADYYFNKIYFTLAQADYFTALTLDGYLKEQRTNPINAASYDYFWGEKLSDFYPSIDELVKQKVVKEKMEAVVRSLPDQGYKNLLVKAEINSALGRYDMAQLYLDRVIALAPHWPAAYLGQGKLSASRGNLKEALVAYNLALLNLPAVDDSRLNAPHRALVNTYLHFINEHIGDIYATEQNYPAAEKYFQLAYRADIADFTLLKKIADTHYRRGDLKQAIRYTERGFMRSPKDYKWPLALASLYYENGNQKTALEYLKKAWELAPGNQEVLDLKIIYGK